MQKYVIKVDAVMYGTAYYTVCAEDGDEARQKYRDGDATYDDTEWSGDTEENDIYEVEEEDCGSCDECCNDEPDDEDEEPEKNDCRECQHFNAIDSWCNQEGCEVKDPVGECDDFEQLVKPPKHCRNCVHGVNNVSEDDPTRGPYTGICKKRLHQIRGTYAEQCSLYELS